MNRTELAACAFDVVTDIAGIMRRAHQHHCEWESTIKMMMTKGRVAVPTGGYEIRIIIRPPEKKKSKRRKENNVSAKRKTYQSAKT